MFPITDWSLPILLMPVPITPFDAKLKALLAFVHGSKHTKFLPLGS